MSTRETGSFPYAARRGAFLRAALPFAVLALVEGGVLLLLILLFAHDPAERTALIAAWVLAFGAVAMVLTRPLRTRHRLTPDHLELRFGGARLDLPREWIAAAHPARLPLGPFQPLRPEVEPRRRRLVACLSAEGQVLLRLDRPRRLRMGKGGEAEVVEVLVNADRPEELLAALGLPGEPPAAGPLRLQALSEEVPADSPHPRQVPAVSPAMGSGAGGGPAIRALGLARSFGAHRAVDGLDLEVRRGEVYGFLGPNGAGKTTTIRMLVGLIEPDAGEVRIAGHDLRAEPLAAKSAFGYVPDRALLYDRLTGREFLEFLAQLRGIPEPAVAPRIRELLELLELAGAADRLCGGYSFGMKRKLALAGALLHRPAVLILDEPFNGLDPRSARRLKDLLGHLAAEGTGLLLSTHDLATAEAVCHRVGILHRGRLVAEGSAEELRSLATGASPDLEAVFLELTAEQGSAEEPAA